MDHFCSLMTPWLHDCHDLYRVEESPFWLSRPIGMFFRKTARFCSPWIHADRLWTTTAVIYRAAAIPGLASSWGIWGQVGLQIRHWRAIFNILDQVKTLVLFPLVQVVGVILKPGRPIPGFMSWKESEPQYQHHNGWNSNSLQMHQWLRSVQRSTCQSGTWSFFRLFGSQICVTSRKGGQRSSKDADTCRIGDDLWNSQRWLRSRASTSVSPGQTFDWLFKDISNCEERSKGSFTSLSFWCHASSLWTDFYCKGHEKHAYQYGCSPDETRLFRAYYPFIPDFVQRKGWNLLKHWHIQCHICSRGLDAFLGLSKVLSRGRGEGG